MEKPVSNGMSVALAAGLMKRLLAGIRYAFGYKSRYGNWDTFIFNEEDKERLEKYLVNKRISELCQLTNSNATFLKEIKNNEKNEFNN